MDAGVADRWAAQAGAASDALGMKHLKDDELVSALSAEVGQELRAAVYARLDTVFSPARMLTALGNYLIARPAARAAAHRITERTDVPLDSAMILGITADTAVVATCVHGRVPPLVLSHGRRESGRGRRGSPTGSCGGSGCRLTCRTRS